MSEKDYAKLMMRLRFLSDENGKVDLDAIYEIVYQYIDNPVK